MEVEQQVLKRCILLTLRGRIDGSAAPEFRKFVQDLTDAENRRFVLNMEGVSYVSSAFLRELISAQKTCRRYNKGDFVSARSRQRS